MNPRRAPVATGPLALLMLALLGLATPVSAHHVLGRPAYSVGADSNTPPGLQVETQIGHYLVTYMAFPAFPKPNEPGRVNLYATHLDTGEIFRGEVTFKVRDDRWFAPEEVLGVQAIDDNVYRQGFEFSRAGDYIISAVFEAGGEPYIIDFPLRIGDPAPIGPIGWTVGAIGAVLVGVNLAQRKRRWRLQAERKPS